jgi:hypothetical protein
MAACAAVVGFGFGPPGRAALTPTSPILTTCATEIQQITGGQIEIQTTPVFATDPVLPVICRRIDEAFREAAADPETRSELDHIVHVIDIDSMAVGDQVHSVQLKHEVLTIQTRTDSDAVDSLSPLIVEVLKKVAHLEAKRQR